MLGLPAYLEKKMCQPVAIFGSGISGLAVAELLEKLNWNYEFYGKDGKEFTKKCNLWDKDRESTSEIITKDKAKEAPAEPKVAGK